MRERYFNATAVGSVMPRFYDMSVFIYYFIAQHGALRQMISQAFYQRESLRQLMRCRHRAAFRPQRGGRPDDIYRGSSSPTLARIRRRRQQKHAARVRDECHMLERR